MEKISIRNPIIKAERGKIYSPKWAEKIIIKNRNLWKNKESKNFEKNLNNWVGKINIKINKLRGNKNKNPKFSIIVPAHNEEEYILQLLESIGNQKNKIENTEVFVVVNDSDDRTAELARKCGVNVIDYKKDKPYPPVAYARQRGLEESKGEIILSTDADTIVGENWIEQITKPIIKNKKCVVSIGHINNYDGISPALLNPIRGVLRQYEVSFKPTKGIVSFANIAIKKDDLIKAGGWPQLSVSEDTFLIRNLMKIGNAKIANMKATVWCSGRREMVSFKGLMKELNKDKNHFIDKDGRLKIVR